MIPARVGAEKNLKNVVDSVVFLEQLYNIVISSKAGNLNKYKAVSRYFPSVDMTMYH